MTATAEACERLFAVMDNPGKVTPDLAYPWQSEQHSWLASQETPLRGPLLDASPPPPPLQPQT